jgi:hypothetical protein
MNKIVLLFIILALPVTHGFPQTGREQSVVHDCRVSLSYGFQTVSFALSGNVFEVKDPAEHADLRIRVVDSPAAAVLYVYRTTGSIFDCGVWRFVGDRRRARFSVRFVKEHEDITVFWVNSPKLAGSRY